MLHGNSALAYHTRRASDQATVRRPRRPRYCQKLRPSPRQHISFLRTVVPGDNERDFFPLRIAADESEILAIGRKRNRAVNVRHYFAWRAAEQRNLVEPFQNIPFMARDVVDKAVVE